MRVCLSIMVQIKDKKENPNLAFTGNKMNQHLVRGQGYVTLTHFLCLLCFTLYYFPDVILADVAVKQ